jgi:hypothetical protein
MQQKDELSEIIAVSKLPDSLKPPLPGYCRT